MDDIKYGNIECNLCGHTINPIYMREHKRDCMQTRITILEERIKTMQSENKKLELKLHGRLANKDGEYDPILVQLSYLKKIQAENKQLQSDNAELVECLKEVKEVINGIDNATLDCFCHTRFDSCGLDIILTKHKPSKE